MQEVKVKIKNYAPKVALVHDGNLKGKLLQMMLWSLGALAVFYVVILGNMVWNIIERKSLESQARALTNEVAQLELSYLSLSSNIDLNFSYALGYKEVANKEFAVRKTPGVANAKSVRFAFNEI